MNHRNPPKNPVKALKRAARDAYGLEPTRITRNNRKYARSRENAAARRAIEEATATASGL